MPSSAWRSTLFPYTTLFRSDRKSTRLNSSHDQISYAVFCLKKKKYKDVFTVPRGPYTPDKTVRLQRTFLQHRRKPDCWMPTSTRYVGTSDRPCAPWCESSAD